MRSSIRFAVPVAFALGILVGPLASAQSPAQQLRVRVNGVQSRGGNIGCALYRGERGFPTERQHALRQVTVRARGRTAVCVFDDLPPGTYAVSVMHDQDADGQLDTNLFGAPSEGWAVSNDAPASTFGPPSYGAASFRYAGGQGAIQVRMRY